MTAEPPNILVVITIVLAIFIGTLLVVIGLLYQANKWQLSDPPTLDQCLEFPAGYELISSDSSSAMDYYFCRNLENGQYRVCNPQIVECEE